MLKRWLMIPFKFLKEVCDRIIDYDLLEMANALTFKLILSIFPFIIFLMSCVGYLELDISGYVASIQPDVPQAVSSMIGSFVKEVIDTKHASLLSSSLLLTMFSASSGLYTLMKGLNRAYGVRDKRNYIIQRLISLMLVAIFTLLIIISLYAFIFSDKITAAALEYDIKLPTVSESARSYVITLMLLFVMIILMYMLALVVRPKIRQLIPGTAFTVIGWVALSKIFNIYVNNFSKYSTIYGSIGAIFVFGLWLNLISYVLLIGGQINAVIYDKKRQEEGNKNDKRRQ